MLGYLKVCTALSSMIRQLRLKNFRGFQEIDLALERVVVLLGPNASGKSSLLDSLSFLRDWAINGAEIASRRRDHGIGLRFDGAGDGDLVELDLETEESRYQVSVALVHGRLDPFFGESLFDKATGREVLKRRPGSTKVSVLVGAELRDQDLPEPEKPALNLGLYRETNLSMVSVERILRRIYPYRARGFNFGAIQKRGSETDAYRYLSTSGENLWTLLRNLNDRRAIDQRFETILKFMRAAFPRFRDLVLESTSPSVVIGSFVEHDRRAPIRASGVSDGYLQLLLLLAALFGQEPGEEQLILLDEPETSLHPAATAVLAAAIREAADEHWRRQVIVASHHAALLSQVEPSEVWELHSGKDRRIEARKVDQIPEIRELLDDYALGSLFLAGLIGAQQHEEVESVP